MIDPFEPPDRPAPPPDGWVTTSRGQVWSLDDPRPKDVHIEDIAAGLSRECRYNGQLREDCDFLSVAEHSVAMAVWAVAKKVVRYREDALAILLHDASEAILGDMVSPVKARDPIFKAIEAKTEDVIARRFGIKLATLGITKEQIKTIDRRIWLDERERAIADPARLVGMREIWADDPSLKKLGVDLPGLNPGEARKLFLQAFIHIVENLPLRDMSLASEHERQRGKAAAMLERQIERERTREAMRAARAALDNDAENERTFDFSM